MSELELCVTGLFKLGTSRLVYAGCYVEWGYAIVGIGAIIVGNYQFGNYVGRCRSVK